MEQLTPDLMEVHAEARRDGPYAAAVAAHALVAKMHGFVVDSLSCMVKSSSSRLPTLRLRSNCLMTTGPASTAAR